MIKWSKAHIAKYGNKAPNVTKNCKDCQEKLLLATKAASNPKLSIVIATRDESDLPNTINSIKETTDPPYDLMIIDDGSKLPVKDAYVRNKKAVGSPCSRALGCDYARGEYIAVTDAHMRFTHGALRSLCTVAHDTGGVAYPRCNSSRGAEIQLINGTLEARWVSKPETHKTTAMMGACYVMKSDLLLNMGGWPILPGQVGSQELLFSLIAAGHGVPLTVCANVDVHHTFRKKPPYPADGYGFALNKALAHRLPFDDDDWKYWSANLIAAGMSPQIVAEANRAEYRVQGETLRDRFKYAVTRSQYV